MTQSGVRASISTAFLDAVPGAALLSLCMRPGRAKSVKARSTRGVTSAASTCPSFGWALLADFKDTSKPSKLMSAVSDAYNCTVGAAGFVSATPFVAVDDLPHTLHRGTAHKKHCTGCNRESFTCAR